METPGKRKRGRPRKNANANANPGTETPKPKRPRTKKQADTGTTDICASPNHHTNNYQVGQEALVSLNVTPSRLRDVTQRSAGTPQPTWIPHQSSVPESDPYMDPQGLDSPYLTPSQFRDLTAGRTQSTWISNQPQASLSDQNMVQQRLNTPYLTPSPLRNLAAGTPQPTGPPYLDQTPTSTLTPQTASAPQSTWSPYLEQAPDSAFAPHAAITPQPFQPPYQLQSPLSTSRSPRAYQVNFIPRSQCLTDNSSLLAHSVASMDACFWHSCFSNPGSTEPLDLVQLGVDLEKFTKAWKEGVYWMKTRALFIRGLCPKPDDRQRCQNLVIEGKVLWSMLQGARDLGVSRKNQILDFAMRDDGREDQYVEEALRTFHA